LQEDVTLEFARWLDPKFAIWFNARIKELLKYGATALNPEDLLNPDFIIKLATQSKGKKTKVPSDICRKGTPVLEMLYNIAKS